MSTAHVHVCAPSAAHAHSHCALRSRRAQGPSEEHPHGMFCTSFGNPGSEDFGDESVGYASFDNILLAFLSIFQYVGALRTACTVQHPFV